MPRIFSLSLILLTALSIEALACRCLPPKPPAEAMEKSLGVFAGKVTATKVNGQQLIATVSVSQSWKGEPAREVTVRTASSSAACGIAFKADTEYLFYCTGEKEGVWATNSCTRTRGLKGAKEDLEALGPGEMSK
jgi:hypothetical protein